MGEKEVSYNLFFNGSSSCLRAFTSTGLAGEGTIKDPVRQKLPGPGLCSFYSASGPEPSARPLSG